MCCLVVEELDLLGSLLLFDLAARLIARVNCLDLASQLNNFVRLLLFLGVKFGDALLKISLTVLGLKLLAHGKSNRATQYNIQVSTLSSPHTL